MLADGRFIPQLGAQTWLHRCADRLKRPLRRSNKNHTSCEEYDFQALDCTSDVPVTQPLLAVRPTSLSEALEGSLQPSALGDEEMQVFFACIRI